MKNLIYQVSVGNPPEFYNYCNESVKQYCKKYNIDYILQTDPILKIKPINSHRSENALRLSYLPIYEKSNAFNYVDDYDNICIIDSDIFIRDTAPNIFSEIDDKNVFYGVLEKKMPLTDRYISKIVAYSRGQYGSLKDVNINHDSKGYDFYNMGLMLFTNKIKQYLNGQSPEQFIRRKEFERFVNGEGNWKWSTDQTLLNYWVRKSGMPHKHIDWKWNALFKGIQDNKLPEAHFIHFFLANNLPQKGKEIPNIIKNLKDVGNIKQHG